MRSGCSRYVLNVDGEAERCGAPLTEDGRTCAAGHQPYQPPNVQPLPTHTYPSGRLTPAKGSG